MDNNEIKVSVLCTAFNHAKYIRETLDAFVSQVTDFGFEVIVHDDASTDETADIIREYAERFPAIIRPVLQQENQYSQNIDIFKQHINPLVRGKYVALCEGDDYWTDTNKLQKQFDVMENNPECSMSTNAVLVINEDGTPTMKYRPSVAIDEGPIAIERFLEIQHTYPFQTASFFVKSELWFDICNNPPAFRKAADVGDEPILLYMLLYGDIYYLPQCMSVYRAFSVGSWSASNKFSIQKRLRHAECMYEMMRLFDEQTNHAYDCNLDYRRGTVLWLSEEYRELAKKENRAYVKQMSFCKRMFVYLCAVFPFVAKIRGTQKR